jgi:hypothetical protein
VEIVMSGSVWDLASADDCALYRPGHQVHHVQYVASMRIPSPIILVTAVVTGDGLVHIEGDDLSLVMWDHRPQVLREVLERFGSQAEWKPRWLLLHVPAVVAWGNASSVFLLASPDRRSVCVPRPRPVDPPPWGEPPEAWERYRGRAEAEQEARNAALRKIDYSHIPLLRLADRYAHGRRPSRPATATASRCSPPSLEDRHRDGRDHRGNR